MIWCICGYHYKHFVSTATKGMGIMLKLRVPPTEPTILSNGISSFFLEIHKMLKFTVCCLKSEAICLVQSYAATCVQRSTAGSTLLRLITMQASYKLLALAGNVPGAEVLQTVDGNINLSAVLDVFVILQRCL